MVSADMIISTVASWAWTRSWIGFGIAARWRGRWPWIGFGITWICARLWQPYFVSIIVTPPFPRPLIVGVCIVWIINRGWWRSSLSRRCNFIWAVASGLVAWHGPIVWFRAWKRVFVWRGKCLRISATHRIVVAIGIPICSVLDRILRDESSNTGIIAHSAERVHRFRRKERTDSTRMRAAIPEQNAHKFVLA